jgi:hypothetical protein
VNLQRPQLLLFVEGVLHLLRVAGLQADGLENVTPAKQPVEESELSREPDSLVQFIELAILPIAAGLEGLPSIRNRVKIVFHKVSQLLEYRRTMALAAPEVVALSTLGFDPVKHRDKKLVVIVAPAPDDERMD